MGRHVDPWWSVWFHWPGSPTCMQFYSVKVGPMILTVLFRNWKARKGIWLEWVGTRVTTWMDGDCF